MSSGRILYDHLKASAPCHERSSQLDPCAPQHVFRVQVGVRSARRVAARFAPIPLLSSARVALRAFGPLRVGRLCGRPDDRDPCDYLSGELGAPFDFPSIPDTSVVEAQRLAIKLSSATSLAALRAREPHTRTLLHDLSKDNCRKT
jgi:hypothetical protein